MARLNRLVVPGEVHLVRQAAAAGLAPFDDPGECDAFLASLRRAATERGVAIHGYCLLPDSWLLLGTPSQADSLGKMMQAISRWFVAGYNRRHARAGGLWRSRFTAAPLSAAHVVDVLIYLEQAPVRAGLVGAAAEYPWSSAPHHASGARDPIVSGNPALWALGNTPFEREASHRRLLETGITAQARSQIEDRLLMGWAWADSKVLAQWAAAGRRTTPLARGRPRRSKNQSVPI